MAIENIIQEKCIGCGKCAKVCLADVIRIDENTKKAYVKYKDDCMLCLWCINECPAEAIVLSENKMQPMFQSW